jgi:cell division protein FtsI/penicillin-binding protein 2
MQRNTGKKYHIHSRSIKNNLAIRKSNTSHKKYFISILENFVNKFSSKKNQNNISSQFKNKPNQTNKYSQNKVSKNKVSVFKILFKLLSFTIIFLLKPITIFYSYLKMKFEFNPKRTDLFKSVYVATFLIIVLKFANLQVFPEKDLFKTQSKGSQFTPSIISAKRGQILIKDLSQNKQDVPVTASHVLSNIYIDPSVLKKQVSEKTITLEKAAELISGGLNIDYKKIYDKLNREISVEEPPKYSILEKYITKNQQEAVEYLRHPAIDPTTKEYVQPSLASWLGHETEEVRVYPENKLLASTLGFVPRYPAPKDEAINTGCGELVKNNEERGTDNIGYTIGKFGLEQKYCTELGGVNGKSLFSQDFGIKNNEGKEVQNGANIYLTIDINLQRKAEEILEKAVKSATNKLAGPKDGSAIIMEVETGKVLAMASYPTFDPNEYNKADQNAFRNTSTSGSYEVGSVMKPLTMASTLNEFQLGNKDNTGKRLGTSPDWSFQDYGKDGKIYKDANNYEYRIQNADGYSYEGQGQISLSQILRDSINTGIAEIIPTIGNEKLRSYYLDKFKVGKETTISLPGDVPGYNEALLDDKNIYSDFVFATFGFGQGFYLSPVQLLRAYTPLANDGVIVEPFIVEDIVDSNGKHVQPKDKKPEPEAVIDAATSRLVTGYLVNTIDQGYLGKKPSKGQVPGYSIAGKTGTAEVGRPSVVKCGDNVSTYACNRQQGIYDHTFIGYGPEKDPKYMVLLKLSEPDPGNVQNFAENTLGPSFSELMKYTLEYNQVPKDR